MPTDLGLVPNPSKRHADVFSPDGARYGLAETGLADARRADEAEDRRPQLVARELANRDELDDAIFYLLQPVVVLVENVRRLFEVKAILRHVGPWQVRQPLQVGADDPDLRREGMLLLQALDLDKRLLLDIVRHPGGLDLLATLVRQGLFRRAITQLLLDRPELLPQEVLALLLVHPSLRFGLYLLPQVEHIEPLLDKHTDLAQALEGIDRLHHLLPLIRGELRREGNQIGKPAWLIDTLHHLQHFLGDIRQHRDVALDLIEHRPHRRFSFG